MHGLSIQKRLWKPQTTRKIFSLVAGILCLGFGSGAKAQTTTAEDIVSHMSLQQRVGQVFIWTYAGNTLNSVAQTALEKFQPGALIAFGRNIQSSDQIANLNRQILNYADKKMAVVPFLMVDQEGGTVTRLRTAVPLPSALALGKAEDAEFIRKFALSTAKVLRDVGFTVNLAPVLDISNPNKDSFIGSRAFGNNPAAVAELTSAYAQGMSEGGMIPTAKHFPGHGGIIQDSHHITPKKFSTDEQLTERDLVPFEEFADAEYPRAVMMAHLALPKIDPSELPATYSKILIHDYLREKLGFDGLVITDDLEMGGASVGKDIGDRAIRAFLAGNDMLMLAGSFAHQKRAYFAMLEAVKSGRISKERLDESVLRIVQYKVAKKVGNFDYQQKQVHDDIAALESLSRDVLRSNFLLSIKGKSAQWADVHPVAETLVFSSDRHFFDSFAGAFKGKAEFFHLTPQSLSRAAAAIGNREDLRVIFYASGSQTAHWLNNLSPQQRARTIVVNANHPGEVEAQESFLSVLNVNTLNPESGGALAEALNSLGVEQNLSSAPPPPPPADVRTPAGGDAPADEDSQK